MAMYNTNIGIMNQPSSQASLGWRSFYYRKCTTELTCDCIQEHEVLEVGDLTTLPLLGHVGVPHQLPRGHHGGASVNEQNSVRASSTNAQYVTLPGSVGIATGYRLDDRGSGIRFPVDVGSFSLLHCVQTGSGAHPASYTIGTGGSFLGGKVAEA
jgi:hypothetical protein